MHCLDCAMNALHRGAVAICAHCGAGVCLDHAVVAPHRLTRGAVLLRQDPVDPPARRILCLSCAAAEQAAGAPAGRAIRPRQSVKVP